MHAFNRVRMVRVFLLAEAVPNAVWRGTQTNGREVKGELVP